MSQKHEGRSMAFPVSAALHRCRLVILSAGQLAYAGATDKDPLGFTTKESFNAGDYTPIDLLNAEGTFKATVDGAYMKGAELFQGASGKLSGSGTVKRGILLETTTADGDLAEVFPISSSGGRNITIALAAGAANVMTITISVKDNNGNLIAQPHALEFWNSTLATGIGLSATAYSGALAATTGAILTAFTAKHHASIVTAATGIAVLTITDTGKPATEYMVVKHPDNGTLVVSGASGANWG